jgi:hypothetical protein
MTPSSASDEKRPKVIRVPRTQVTPDPIRGYTTADFWRDLEDRQRRSRQELTRLRRMVARRRRDADD